MVTMVDIPADMPRAERRRELRAQRQVEWHNRERPNGLPRLRYPQAHASRPAPDRSKYMPHIGAKQRRKGLARLARENAAVAAE